MSTSAIAGSSLVCGGASLTGASVGTLELGVADSAFAEFLSSLVSVGAESKTAAGEAGTCTEPDGEIESLTREKSVTSDSDLEELEDTSSQQIAYFLISVAQPAPQAPVVGSFSSESVKDEPAREVAHSTEAKGVSMADGDSADTSPDFAVEGSEITEATKGKFEASLSEGLDLADDVVKREPILSGADVPILAHQSDGETQQTAADSRPLEKIAPQYSSDQSSQGVQPVFHAVSDRSVPTLKPNDQPVAGSRDENPAALRVNGDASGKSIESDVSSVSIKDRIPAQHNGEKRGEPLTERTAFVLTQATPPQVAPPDSGESVTSDMKVSPHFARDTVGSRNVGTAQEMQVALDTDLGKVHIRAELGKDDRVSAVIQADHKETGAILAEQAPVLERALADKNVSLGSFQVADGTTNFGQSSNHSTPHRSEFERFSVATSSGSDEAATHEQESYEPEERKLSVRV